MDFRNSCIESDSRLMHFVEAEGGGSWNVGLTVDESFHGSPFRVRRNAAEEGTLVAQTDSLAGVSLKQTCCAQQTYWTFRNVVCWNLDMSELSISVDECPENFADSSDV